MASERDEVSGYDDDHDPVLDPESLGLTSETICDGGFGRWDALLAAVVIGGVVLLLIAAGRT